MTAIWVLIAIVVIVLIAGYGWYMALIKRRNSALEALSSIDVQLRKRADLVPNVLKIAKRFMEHEKDLMSQITELRASSMRDYSAKDPASVKEHLQSAGALSGAMMRLFAVAENYPQLKSNETMINAQDTYVEVEGHIAASRRFYNAAVAELNNAVQIFPGNILAGIANVREMPFFEETDEAAKKPIDAGDYLN
jgi:LemA protein